MLALSGALSGSTDSGNTPDLDTDRPPDRHTAQTGTDTATDTGGDLRCLTLWSVIQSSAMTTVSRLSFLSEAKIVMMSDLSGADIMLGGARDDTLESGAGNDLLDLGTYGIKGGPSYRLETFDVEGADTLAGSADEMNFLIAGGLATPESIELSVGPFDATELEAGGSPSMRSRAAILREAPVWIQVQKI